MPAADRQSRPESAPMSQVDADVDRRMRERLQQLTTPHDRASIHRACALLRDDAARKASHSALGQSDVHIYDGYDDQIFSVFCYT